MRGKIGWWVRQAGLILLGGFFLYFGIVVLVGAYALDNPITFIMTFFASNLIILISTTILIGIIYRMIRFYREQKGRDKSLIRDVKDDS